MLDVWSSLALVSQGDCPEQVTGGPSCLVRGSRDHALGVWRFCHRCPDSDVLCSPRTAFSEGRQDPSAGAGPERHAAAVCRVLRRGEPRRGMGTSAGNWGGVSTAKALVIVWRDRMSRCRQVHSNYIITAASWLVLARILSLQTIPSAIAVLIRS